MFITTPGIIGIGRRDERNKDSGIDAMRPGQANLRVTRQSLLMDGDLFLPLFLLGMGGWILSSLVCRWGPCLSGKATLGQSGGHTSCYVRYSTQVPTQHAGLWNAGSAGTP